jgi:hypothetical protein
MLAQRFSLALFCALVALLVPALFPQVISPDHQQSFRTTFLVAAIFALITPDIKHVRDTLGKSITRS